MDKALQTGTDAVPPVVLSAKTAPESRSPWRMALRRFLRHRAAVTGGLILLGIALYIGIGSVVFSERDANFNDTSIRLQGPSQEYPFGTDSVGRDVLARTVYGGQISLIIGVFAMLVAITLGTSVGALSGYYGGLVDALLMRLTETMLSIPNLLILLVMAKFFGGRIPNVEVAGRTFSGSILVIILIIGFTSWMYLARIVRSLFLKLKEEEFILAARALGVPNTRIILVHILPNAMAPIIVAATLGIGAAIITEAYISFLGLGVGPPSASWGNMLTGGQRFVERAPWLWFFPSLLIILTVLSINFLGDGLRDALDPHADKKV
ncbi:MAG: ABC transporter permease [Anaerolineae bacterium]|nr:ABC transporter permease [Anaerolineae bacterium]